MADAVQLAALLGSDRVDEALGIAAIAGRFAEADLASITGHRGAAPPSTDKVSADETHSTQPGTASWAGFTTDTTSTQRKHP